ncbi:MAG: UDP-N-acetylglucosamine 2-epimerase [Elusimicrobia bacterium]|nr:UDP-N-acetylglucosamine 2-epimerase [Elusimicrobiota bacterium]
MEPVHYPLKIALIYGYTPSGHSSAAKAIADFFPQSILEPVFINLSEVYKGLGPLVAKTYLQILQKTPALWGYVYDNEIIARATKTIKTALIPYYAHDLNNLLVKKNVKAIVTTHALPSILLSKREKELKNIPLFGVITDFYAHSYWPPAGVNAYFVPGKTAQENLVQNGFPESRVCVSGIPIRKEFLETFDAYAQRKELGLSGKLFTVLISGGSRGLGNIEKIVGTMKHFLNRIQIIILCGENKTLQKKLEKTHHDKKHIKIFGLVESTVKYFAASDIIIGKPGGVTSAESMALEKPLIIFSPLPGQEERNAGFLARHRLAEFAKDAKQLESAVRRYLHNPHLVAGVKKHLKNFSKPYASKDIVSKIMEHILKPIRY